MLCYYSTAIKQISWLAIESFLMIILPRLVFLYETAEKNEDLPALSEFLSFDEHRNVFSYIESS